MGLLDRIVQLQKKRGVFGGYLHSGNVRTNAPASVVTLIVSSLSLSK